MLQEVGIIIFKKGEMDQKNVCFLVVKFEDGVMEMARYSMEDLTISLVDNPLVFQQCSPKSLSTTLVITLSLSMNSLAHLWMLSSLLTGH